MHARQCTVETKTNSLLINLKVYTRYHNSTAKHHRAMEEIALRATPV